VPVGQAVASCTAVVMQAAVQDADEPVGQGAQGLVVVAPRARCRS
jgi:hypothetical protein